MSNLSNPPRRLAPGSATPVTPATQPVAVATAVPAPAPAPAPAPTPATATVATAVLTARLSGANTVTSSALTLDQSASRPTQQPMLATSCPDSPIRRVSSSLKNSALDFASRFFNKCKAATFTVDGATYTIGCQKRQLQQQLHKFDPGTK
ncbi:GH13065 [Drosophila grimshawi]|uniref:GH13065 n=1 Tax=Drosophila grimshawi TaxID=7222 RepID=B4JR41_DROGR|nr:GH13065 [Drosophila grimshawi]